MEEAHRSMERREPIIACTTSEATWQFGLGTDERRTVELMTLTSGQKQARSPVLMALNCARIDMYTLLTIGRRAMNNVRSNSK